MGDKELVKKFHKVKFVDLPFEGIRKQIFLDSLQGIPHALTESDIKTIVEKTKGFGADEIIKAVGIAKASNPSLTAQNLLQAVASMVPAVSQETREKFYAFKKEYDFLSGMSMT